MASLVKSKVPITVPSAIQRQAGIKAGDHVEFRVSGGVISILPKLPAADDDYTPAQRRAIDAQLDEAAKGPYYGPFETADAAIAFLKREIKARKPGKQPLAKRKSSYLTPQSNP